MSDTVVRLNTTSRLPPGGWIYEQLGNDGKVFRKFSSMSPFGDVVKDIVECRKLNGLPRATTLEASEDLDAAQCARLGDDPRWCLKKKTEYQFPTTWQNLANLAQRVVSKVEAIPIGASVLNEWLGDGAVPVAHEEAQARADVCTGRLNGKPCPHNQSESIPLSETVIAAIKRQVEKKNELKLAVEGESDLKTCDICWCRNELKVHVPMSTLREQMPQKLFDKFAAKYPACWMNQKAK